MNAILITATKRQGIIKRARDLAKIKGGPFRAPHHSCSTALLQNEVAIAATGTILLDEPEQFASSSSMAIHLGNAMVPAAQPLVIIVIAGDDPKILAFAFRRVAKNFGALNVVEHIALG